MYLYACRVYSTRAHARRCCCTMLLFNDAVFFYLLFQHCFFCVYHAVIPIKLLFHCSKCVCGPSTGASRETSIKQFGMVHERQRNDDGSVSVRLCECNDVIVTSKQATVLLAQLPLEYGALEVIENIVLWWQHWSVCFNEAHARIIIPPLSKQY